MLDIIGLVQDMSEDQFQRIREKLLPFEQLAKISEACHQKQTNVFADISQSCERGPISSSMRCAVRSTNLFDLGSRRYYIGADPLPFFLLEIASISITRIHCFSDSQFHRREYGSAGDIGMPRGRHPIVEACLSVFRIAH